MDAKYKPIYDYRKLPEVVTSTEAAKYLRINRKTLSRLALAGEIPSVKVGQQRRYLREQLRAYMEGQYEQNRNLPMR